MPLFLAGADSLLGAAGLLSDDDEESLEDDEDDDEDEDDHIGGELADEESFGDAMLDSDELMAEVERFLRDQPDS